MPKASLPFDLDNIFAYKTGKVVRIRDRKLGIAKLLITIGIFVYVVIYEAILQQGYLLKETPQGTVMTTLRRPIDAEISPLPTYCSPNTDPVVGEDRLPCEWLDEIDVLFPAGEELGSMFLTTRVSYANDTSEPGCNERLLYTENSAGKVQLVTADGARNCNTPQVYDQIKDVDFHYYIAEIERFTMLWAHAVYGPKSKDVRYNTDLKFAQMEMYTKDDIEFDEYDRNPPNLRELLTTRGYAGTEKGDIMTVAVLMDGAQLREAPYGLNAISPQSTDATCVNAGTDNLNTSICNSGCHWVGERCSYLNAAGEATCNAAPKCTWNTAASGCFPTETSGVCIRNTIRYDGGVFLVMIDYQTPKLTMDDMGYEYNVRYIPKAEYKVITKIRSTTNPDKTQYLNRHGIRILFVQTGFITRFSFVELLKTLVAGVTLFAVANVVVELLLMRLLPGKHIYENYKYLTSEDFSVVKVTDENPFGGLISDDFVFGVNRPGHAPELSVGDKNSEHDVPLAEQEGDRQKEFQRPAKAPAATEMATEPVGEGDHAV
eukprot:TRINITY_DN60721_c0_g1_i1.p2 TRINITY_DN60721_c0_g1~~TRINITY_DN60721_c0_g1_i1.p2  ORF type:complete len:572 (+),score=229.03 TRINITY_DN60721_c0_g1_i1:82-1716(+)